MLEVLTTTLGRTQRVKMPRPKHNKAQNHSDSLPELSSELESEEWSLSCRGMGAEVGTAVFPEGLSNSFIRSSSCRIFSASAFSSMLLRLRPPVPVPFPVARLRF